MRYFIRITDVCEADNNRFDGSLSPFGTYRPAPVNGSRFGAVVYRFVTAPPSGT